MANTSQLADALQHQAKSCTDLGSPFMGQLLNVMADRLRPGTPVTDRLFEWAGDISSSGHSVPLRLAGALHRLVLTGQDGGLIAAYPPNQVDDETLWRAVSGAMETHGSDILNWLESPPQTNEVRRASVLIAAGQVLADRFSLPIMVSELGASAGLNLNWDQFRLDLQGQAYGVAGSDVILSPKWPGNLPPLADVNVENRRGVDLAPVDTTNPDHRMRLKSYLWPDQPERMALTNAAMELPPPAIDQGDAIEWLRTRLTEQNADTLHLIYHTIAWQYFPQDAQRKGRKLIENAGNAATANSPLAWLSMEADNNGPGAGLTLRLWPGDETISLGRADFHGRWVDWAL